MDALHQFDPTFITPQDRQRIDEALTDLSKDSSWELHLSKKEGREIEILMETGASAQKSNPPIRVNPGLYDLFW